METLDVLVEKIKNQKNQYMKESERALCKLS